MTVGQAPVLTLIVPTYNRAGHLAMLLDALAASSGRVHSLMRVIVGDNASTDDTAAVAEGFSTRYRNSQIVRHPENVGAEENFCRCIERVTTRYFWVFGDDDLPRQGLLEAVLELLLAASPDVVHIRSEWVSRIDSRSPVLPIGPFSARQVDANAFMRDVNVWITYISGMVVNREALGWAGTTPSLRRFKGTCLVQLGWVLPLISPGRKLWVIPQRGVLATAGNSGDYKVVEVFAAALPKIVEEVLASEPGQVRHVRNSLAWSYLPALLWAVRRDAQHRFLPEDRSASLMAMRSTLAYPLLLWPLAHLPGPLAYPFLFLSRMITWSRERRFRWRYRHAEFRAQEVHAAQDRG